MSGCLGIDAHLAHASTGDPEVDHVGIRPIEKVVEDVELYASQMVNVESKVQRPIHFIGVVLGSTDVDRDALAVKLL